MFIAEEVRQRHVQESTSHMTSNRGAQDWAKLQGYIGELLARCTVDALNEGKKYCLPIYNSH